MRRFLLLATVIFAFAALGVLSAPAFAQHGTCQETGAGGVCADGGGSPGGGGGGSGTVVETRGISLSTCQGGSAGGGGGRRVCVEE
jgi:hypothetical protein